ncbi:hypothetical protein AAEU42_00170 [Pseudoflavonifractor phocaeensis]|uniref:hypothetical protein n=1 Tax=Pseudoflavonifractor phocaeensis TaxID=1870988 RepID=UPI00313F0812
MKRGSGTEKRGVKPPLRDPQRDAPTAWCRRCRGEIYQGVGPLCPACRAEETGKEDGEQA